MDMKQIWLVTGVIMVGATLGGLAGELIIDGSMVVKTNLVVNGQLSGRTLSLTNLVISGEATVQHAVIQHLAPQGDLGMGPYTNGAAGK